MELALEGRISQHWHWREEPLFVVNRISFLNLIKSSFQDWQGLPAGQLGADSEPQYRVVLQCVAVCCSVLQCGAAWCSVLQCVAVCCRG